jgi:hypothetical protein
MRYRDTLLTVLILLSGLFGSEIQVNGQDDHYWSQQYGAESTLLGGAMVGGANDNSAVYYNPGALAFITNPSLSIDANVYRIDKTLITDGAGKGLNLNSAQISIYPQIISGMLKLLRNDRFRFSYTLLTRNHNNILMNTRYTSKASQSDPDNPIPSATTFIGALDYVNQLDEQWLGMGVGYSVSDKLGIGVTLFGIYRGQTYQLTNYVREVNYMDPYYNYATETNDEAVKYTTIGLLAKAGLSYISGRWKFGVTMTTPSLGLYGSGSIQRENSSIVVSENAADMIDNFLIMDSKSNVKAKYKHPLSVAVGIDYRSPKTRFVVSAEYFSRINTYHLIEPMSEPFVYPSSYLDSASIKPLINSYLHVENASKPVLNAGIGFSCLVAKQLTLLLGAYTDFSSYDKPPEADELLHGSGGWNIYHFSTGISYHKQKHTVTLGLSYAITPSEHIPPYAIINQSPELTNDALLSAKSYSIVLGYTYYFARAE